MLFVLLAWQFSGLMIISCAARHLLLLWPSPLFVFVYALLPLGLHGSFFSPLLSCCLFGTRLAVVVERDLFPLFSLRLLSPPFCCRTSGRKRKCIHSTTAKCWVALLPVNNRRRVCREGEKSSMLVCAWR